MADGVYLSTSLNNREHLAQNTHQFRAQVSQVVEEGRAAQGPEVESGCTFEKEPRRVRNLRELLDDMYQAIDEVSDAK